MKVQLLSRGSSSLRSTSSDIHKVSRNFSPSSHPLETSREYARALNAVKLERVFAKPFLAALDGHDDVVTCLAIHTQRLAVVASGDAGGQVRLWNLASRKVVRRLESNSPKTRRGGNGCYVRGLVFSPDGDRLIGVADDKRINVWQIDEEDDESQQTVRPLDSVLTKGMVSGISHHRCEPVWATCGEQTTLWDAETQTAMQEYSWGVDSVHAVAFNPIETNLLAGLASDRSIVLYDTRDANPMRKVVMELRSNAIVWNPMEAFIFAVANEDYNAYAFDVRFLRRPLNVYQDHTAAVTTVDFAPTGRELVTGSYDKTVRIFASEVGHSREVYHTKRMQRLTCVAFSKDNRFIVSASDEMNLRLWKARAWEPLGPLKERQRMAMNYNNKLKEKFAAHPQVKRIAKHRHVPKHVLNAQREHRTIRESQKRKEANRRRHSKPGSVPYVAERDKHVVREEE